MEYVPYTVSPSGYMSKGAYDKAILSEKDYINLLDYYPCFARIMDDINLTTRMVTWRCDALYGPYDCEHCKFRKEKKNDVRTV